MINISVDISSFMSWWVQQVYNIMSTLFGILNDIQFANTSLLKVLITINILIPLLLVVLTINKNGIVTKIDRGKK